jgi:3'-phosphoadenosine 5'-phosphosulfate sulfotransferase (PAPS reductase)/FAD synthetase
MDRRPDTAKLLPLDQYDHVLVSYSGGKDSLACLLHMLEIGVPRERLELWHQDVGELMDWPCTRPYVEATSKTFDIPLVYAWREGGFEQEMLRQNDPTGPVFYTGVDGRTYKIETKRQSLGTRMKFPQVSADLSVRWCSAYLKIDVMARVIANDPRLAGKRLLIVTGERRQESTARSRYAEVEEHRTTSSKRLAHQWRPVIDWDERKVWDIIKRWKVRPHPAYELGWGRVSCLACIFGDKDQWASVLEIDRDRFVKIASYEEVFGYTIKQGESVVDQAAKGAEFVSDKPRALRNRAMSEAPFGNLIVKAWVMPEGAFKSGGGPT